MYSRTSAVIVCSFVMNDSVWECCAHYTSKSPAYVLCGCVDVVGVVLETPGVSSVARVDTVLVKASSRLMDS